MRLFCLILLLALHSLAFGTTYYVDFDGGSDSAAGTSTGTAWKTIPGTRNVGDTAYQSTSYGGGTFTSGVNKVPAGTIFKIKSGTTHNSSDGGYWFIGSNWYDNASSGSPTVIMRDTTWGTGQVVFDATGMTFGIAQFLVQRDGIEINGVVDGGISLNNSAITAIQFKEQAGTSAPLADCALKYVRFFNFSTSATDDSTGRGKFACQFRRATNPIVDHVTIDGDNNWSNGLCFGEAHMACTGATATDCTATGLLGDTSNNDAGIGFKAFNSQATFLRCASHHNLKGFDLGEESGTDAVYPGGTVADITYKLLNCDAYNNTWGANFNCHSGAAGTYTGTVKFYQVNCLLYNNSLDGNLVYAGPFKWYNVHNTYYNNATDTAGFTASRGHIAVQPDSASDAQHIEVYFRNNAFQKSNSSPTFTNKNSYLTLNDFTIDSDYNSFKQLGSEPFAQWSWNIASTENKSFSYGANGPGHASGNWYTWYGGTTTAPTLGTGHFHCDAHSKGTGCDTATFPAFTNAAANDWTLTAAFPGENISTKPWFITEMGIDRNGNGRTSWDMGAYEYFAGVGHAPTIAISSPSNNSTFYSSDSVTFTGTASDDEDGTISANIVWSSNLDSTLGTGASINHSLTPGTHVITASITDSDGNTVTVTVSPVVSLPGDTTYRGKTRAATARALLTR